MKTITGTSIESGMREIRALLRRRTPYRHFRPLLESAFLNSQQARVLEMLQQGWWVLLLFLAVIGLSSHAEVSALSATVHQAGNLQVWWVIFLLESLVIGALVLLPRIAFLRAHYAVLVPLIAIVAITTITVGTSAFPDPFFQQHSSYVVVFVVALTYGLGAFPLRTAMLACGAAALLSWLFIRHFDLWLDSALFQQYVAVSNVVGMVLCYMVEQRDRRMFLQGCLLQLERDRLDVLSAELERLSGEDALTGLANRRHFNEALLLEWERARRDAQALALVFVDVDHFKAFNDSYGHLEGDAVLARVGAALRACLRRPGDMAARYGGEEFVLLLPATPAPGALEIARQVHRAVAALAIPHRSSTTASHVSVSVGVATMVPGAEGCSEELLAAADAAAYAAKRAGRNRIMVADAATSGSVAAA